ncbi:hypothetical protein [Amaricoccus sp.]|uniref:head-tail connector protein n=1 Tax=Amaricoccus sp. TaxID=1872485 RepID=UPI00262D88E1|nr:hypothetical protein [uncultured Amaricoccus sp.]
MIPVLPSAWPARVTPPATAPVSLAEARQELRVVWPEGSPEDARIEEMLAAAVAEFDGWQGLLGRALEAQTWEMGLARFATPIVLAPGPVASVTAITWRDASGAVAVLAPETYRLDARAVEALVWPVADWPEAVAPGPGQDAVTLRWVAGTGCPPEARRAILALVAHWYNGGVGVPGGVLEQVARLRRLSL